MIDFREAIDFGEVHEGLISEIVEVSWFNCLVFFDEAHTKC